MPVHDFTVTEAFLAVAVASVLAATSISKVLPREVVRALAAWLLRLAYRVEVRGWDNYEKAGERAVIVANHPSALDGPLMAAFLPGRPVLALNTYSARTWQMRLASFFFELLPIDPANPMAAKTLVQKVREGRKCVIFPEGRLTATGALMKIYEGPGMIADLSGATILPVRIEGAQFTRYSRLKGKLRLRRFPRITLTILEPRRVDVPKEIKGRRRRQIAGAELYNIMSDMMFETGHDLHRTLFGSLTDARALHGGQCLVAEDIERKPVSYDHLIAASLTLGRKLSRNTRKGELIGLLLPNSVTAVEIFFALQAYGRVPAMLNYSTGLHNVISACKTAGIRTALTSRGFIEAARLQDMAEALSGHVDMVYLEDIRASLGPFDKLFGLAAGRTAGLVHRWIASGVRACDPAVVLFTSGTEGTPKGVVLSHENIQANRYQLSARIDFNPSDTVFNALPVFHSFGLTGGLLLPLLSGVRTFLYPSPLHYRIVPELIYETDATIFFSTDTFLAGYARAAHPYDFYSVRYVFAGAERLRDETRRIWAERFGLRLFEGYGATETSPVLAINTPMHFKAGTVGRLLPGIRHRLVPVAGLNHGGTLQVSGPNVMLGYLCGERPGELEPPRDGWYDTGDIVEIDGEGYVTILGRAKRFAKIAGEMVSLAAVEKHVFTLWPDHNHAVISVPDSRKGEQLVLVTEFRHADRNALQTHIQEAGGSELMVPKKIMTLDRVPVLASGKTDYMALGEIVRGG